MTGPRPLDQLTSLRFFAAFLVMLSHLDFLAQNGSATVRAVYDRLFHEGYAGVSFFYILSGFIITHAYADALTLGRVSAGEYVARRLARIGPLHWLTAGLFALWLTMLQGEPPAATTALFNLLLLQAWVPDPAVHFALNAPSWSLSNELFFYLMFPLLVLLRLRTLGLLVAGMAAIIAGLAAVFTFALDTRPAWTEWLFYVAPPTRLLEFMTGMLLHAAYRRGLFRRAGGTAAELGLLLLVPLLMLGYSLLDVPMPFRHQLAYVLPMAALVLVFAYGEGAVARGLRSPLLVRLGEASFALYLTHRPIITLAHRLFGGSQDVLLAALLLVICTVVSVVAFSWFDEPVQRVLKPIVGRAFRPASRLAGSK